MKYTIKKGQKDWSPMEFPWPYFPKAGSQWIIDMEFTESCWYNWLPDMDQHDWNKIGGVTNMFSWNDVDSALIAWRPDASEVNRFHLTGYFNIGASIDTSYGVVTCGLRERIRSIITYKGNNTFSITFKNLDTDAEYYTIEKKLDRRFWIGRRVGMNMGGANNSEGPYGGVASQDMEMYVTFWYIR